MHHVPSVPDVTRGADGTYGTFAPYDTWYARVIPMKLTFVFALSEVIRQCRLREGDKSRKKNEVYAL